MLGAAAMFSSSQGYLWVDSLRAPRARRSRRGARRASAMRCSFSMRRCLCDLRLRATMKAA